MIRWSSLNDVLQTVAGICLCLIVVAVTAVVVKAAWFLVVQL